MSPGLDPPAPPPRHDEQAWAQLIARLKVSQVPAGAVNLNVDGRRVVGPLQGFGRLWQKTFRARLAGVQVTPAEVVALWKAEFPRFQPHENRFYPGAAGIQPGEIVLINASLQGLPVDTGMLVLYSDEEAFTLMTPEGHPESAWITFSAFEQDGCTVAQVQTLARANDPIFEVGFRMFGARAQERIWIYVLRSLATRLGVRADVTMAKECIDPRVQWSQIGNVWKNASVRSVLYVVVKPVLRLRAISRGRPPGARR